MLEPGPVPDGQRRPCTVVSMVDCTEDTRPWCRPTLATRPPIRGDSHGERTEPVCTEVPGDITDWPRLWCQCRSRSRLLQDRSMLPQSQLVVRRSLWFNVDELDGK
uniref:(northern house mosquito) hypothetical protein n=1 Tax=Culex pipiens TaxID=7175 RepID=A0A8D8FWU8_CULPI